MYLAGKQWSTYILLSFMSMSLLGQLVEFKGIEKKAIQTKIGTVKLQKSDFELVNEINEYLNQNIKPTDSLIVVPEGQIFNLMHNKNWEFYNSTFTPLDFETFNEKELTDKLQKNKTTYIIIYPRNTREYGASTICEDYGVDFCAYIKDNYKHKKTFGSLRKAYIYKYEKE